jgi:hypothetical protein
MDCWPLKSITSQLCFDIMNQLRVPQLCASLLDFSIYTWVRITIPINQFKLYRTEYAVFFEEMNCFSLLHVFVPRHQLL